MTPRARAAMRLAAAVPLAAALWPDNAPPPGSGDLVVLVDRSASQRGKAADAAVQIARTAAESLADGGSATVTGFARTPDTAAGTDGTDIAAAVRAGLDRLDPERPAALLLISDGGATRGDTRRALEDAQARGIPVFAADPRESLPGNDIWIGPPQVAPTVATGASIPLTVTAGAERGGPLTVNVAVDGRTVETRTVQAEAGIPAAMAFVLPAAAAGRHRVDVRASGADGDAADPLPDNNGRAVMVTVGGPPDIVVVAGDRATLPILTGPTDESAWRVRRLSPAGLARAAGDLANADAVVLDNVDAAAAPGAGWQALDQAIRAHGTGLLALGGPDAFAAGGYRNSLLESLLPVTAESGRPTGRLSVLFVVDKSGSMAGGTDTEGRLAFARRTIAGTAQLLEPGDASGLVWFDRDVRWALPLAAHGDAARRLAERWAVAASGGTALVPALTEAADALAAAEGRRLLILITDGHVGNTADMAAIGAQLTQADVTLIAVVVGDDAGNDIGDDAETGVETLADLSMATGGRLLRADSVAAVPRAVNRAVAESRAAFDPRPAKIVTVRPLPFEAAPDTWPPTAGHSVTRAREQATTYLETAAGDPLLTFGTAGLARTAVLPADMGAWTAQAAGGGPAALIGGVLAHIAQPGHADDMWPTVVETDDGLSVTVDVDGPAPAAEIRAAVAGPGGIVLESTLSPMAPGRLGTTFTGLPHGIYTVRIASGDGGIRRAVVRDGTPEHDRARAARGWVGRLAAAGLVQPLAAGGRVTAFSKSSPAGPRIGLLIAAAGLFLTSLVTSRLPRRE